MRSQAVGPESRPSHDPRASLSYPDALYEIVDGEVVELPEMGIYATIIANTLAFAIMDFLRQQPPGLVVIEGMFILDGRRDLRRRPDVASVSVGRWPDDREIPEEGDWDVVPDLPIEVVSPNDTDEEVLRKVREYFEYGARLVWTVHPSERLIYVYSSPTEVRIHGPEDEVDGGEILPGFRLPVEPLFRRTLG
jgi:Uma2 family endonuclease